MKNIKSNHKPVILASITASVLMLSFGLTRWVLATKLKNPVSSAPIASDVLQRLPLQIGGWTGIAVPLDDAIVRRTDSDAHINRRYSRGNGLGSVTLYICCGVNIRELMVHRPQVCYPAAGWNLINHSSLELSLDSEKKLPYSIYKFYRGNLNREEVTVLHYFITDGQYHDNVSVLRQRLWKLFSSVPWVAQVQIIASSNVISTTNNAMTRKFVSEFAADSAPLIVELFEQLIRNQCANSTESLEKKVVIQ